MKTIEEILYKHYNEMFDEVLDVVGDDLHELTIEVKTVDGFSVRKSWLEREEWLGGDD